eukprot:767412-Hanusia_phi.AAC.3
MEGGGVRDRGTGFEHGVGSGCVVRVLVLQAQWEGYSQSLPVRGGFNTGVIHQGTEEDWTVDSWRKWLQVCGREPGIHAEPQAEGERKQAHVPAPCRI